MPTYAEKIKVYNALASNGPDPELKSVTFGRLVQEAKKAGVLDNEIKLYRWLKMKGAFGPPSNKFRE